MLKQLDKLDEDIAKILHRQRTIKVLKLLRTQTVEVLDNTIQWNCVNVNEISVILVTSFHETATQTLPSKIKHEKDGKVWKKDLMFNTHRSAILTPSNVKKTIEESQETCTLSKKTKNYLVKQCK